MKTAISKKDAENLEYFRGQLAHVEKMIEGLKAKPSSDLIERLLANKYGQRDELVGFIAGIERKYN